MRRILPILMLVLILALGVPRAAKAHASLVASVPVAGEVLREAPAEIMLEYSEELDSASSQVQLFDAGGQVEGPGAVDPAEPRVLRLQTGSLPDGVYSAVWRVRSAVDGHVTSGSVGFSIGEASPPASLLPPPGTPDPARATPSGAQTFARWLAYLSVTLALGSLAFGFLVWRTAYRLEVSRSQAADETVRRWICPALTREAK